MLISTFLFLKIEFLFFLNCSGGCLSRFVSFFFLFNGFDHYSMDKALRKPLKGPRSISKERSMKCSILHYYTTYHTTICTTIGTTMQQLL